MIPYSGGTAQILNDVMGGRVPLVIEALSGIAGAVEAGTIRPLAVASPQRMPDFPDLPTVAETLPGFGASGWQAMVAPVGTPEPIVQKVSADLRTALNDPAVVKRLTALGRYNQPMTPAEVTAFIHREQATWKPILELIGSNQ
jgi:tripartite-type tricarboxylate transporter receptor subunit TctC